MSLLTVDVARALLHTALDDVQLQTVIDREEQEIVERYGAHYVDVSTTIVETLPGGERNLYLRRGITSVSAVSELADIGPAAATALVAGDYFVWGKEGMLTRLPEGTRWGDQVTVTYVPADDRSKRKEIIAELVRLALERTAMKAESVAGEYSYSAPDWEVARAQLLRRAGFWRA